MLLIRTRVRALLSRESSMGPDDSMNVEIVEPLGVLVLTGDSTVSMGVTLAIEYVVRFETDVMEAMIWVT